MEFQCHWSAGVIIWNIQGTSSPSGWLFQKPLLMPTLIDAANRPVPRGAARGISALYRVVKQQASRRLLPHRKQFFALAAELLPRMHALRVGHAGALLAGLAQRSPDAAATWTGVDTAG